MVENAPEVIFRSDVSCPLRVFDIQGLRDFGRVLVVKLPKKNSQE
jgi:hypothetical protein